MEIKTYSLKDNNYQYKSISNIQKISNYPLIHMDYDYILNLQTVQKLSNTVDIYFNKKELEESLIKPFENILKNRDNIYESKIYNYINSEDIEYYKFIKLLHSKLLYNIISAKGIEIEMDLKFHTEDNRFVILESAVTIKGIFKCKPKEIQPSKLVFSISEVEELLSILYSL